MLFAEALSLIASLCLGVSPVKAGAKGEARDAAVLEQVLDESAKRVHTLRPVIVAPLSTDGFLWAASLSPLPTGNHVRAAFNLNRSDIESSDFSFLTLTVGGEYSPQEKTTVGVDVAGLVAYDVSLPAGDEGGLSFGNVRLHGRYAAYERAEYNFVVTPALRLWLPTNTFLRVNDVDLINGVAVLQPMVLVGWGIPPLSLSLQTGPDLYVLSDHDDAQLWSANLAVGLVVPGVEGLEALVELNTLYSLNDGLSRGGGPPDRGNPTAVSFGGRHRKGAWFGEVAMRIGVHQAELTIGDFNLGVVVGYGVDGLL